MSDSSSARLAARVGIFITLAAYFMFIIDVANLTLAVIWLYNLSHVNYVPYLNYTDPAPYPLSDL